LRARPVPAPPDVPLLGGPTPLTPAPGRSAVEREAVVSVVLPVGRPGPAAARAAASVLAQRTGLPFELIAVGDLLAALPEDSRLDRLVITDPNPSARRNLAASRARGTVLAFLDDDAEADPEWLETGAAFLLAHDDMAAVGGPDPPPEDSGPAELLADTLLATPFVGSGVLCHRGPDGVRDVRSPSDLALVNLFVRRSAFEAAGGLDESLGYGGEDTDLLARLMRRGRVVYHSRVVVRHRRRAFPGAYLAQRWRYRRKTGALLVGGRSPHARDPRLLAFLLAGLVFLLALAFRPALAAAMLGLHALVTLALGTRATRLPARFWGLIPVGFAAHHAVYFAGIAAGAVSALASRRPGA